MDGAPINSVIIGSVLAGGFRWRIITHTNKEKPRLLLLHGFAGSHRTWDFMLPHLREHFQLLLLDLPGHGGTENPLYALSFAEQSDLLERILCKRLPEPFLLGGYSMGGRVALHFALHYPELICGLALIGASPGIVDPHERSARRKSDEELADNILSKGVEWFTEFWQQQPIFESQHLLPRKTRDWIRAERMTCRPDGLAYSLRNFGTGSQEYLIPELVRIQCPTLLIAGERDAKFAHSNDMIATGLHTPHQQILIRDAGHATHIENPQATAEAILHYFHPTQSD